MNKFYFILFLIGLFSGPVLNAQVTVSGANGAGVNGTYTSLTANSNAFAKINAVNQTGATITITITGNTTENGANSLTGAAGMWTSLKIVPSGGVARTISGNITAGTPLINLSGADNVTIDGLNTGGNSLTFSNTRNSVTTNTSTIRFIGGANNNIIRNTTLLGRATTSTTTAIVYFSTGGNNNNLIENNNITLTTGNPATAILNLGTSGNVNTNNTITGNKIYDFSAFAVLDLGYSSGFTISYNEMYSSASGVVSATLTGIRLGNTTNSITSPVINGNYIHDLRTTTNAGDVYGINLYAITIPTTVTVTNNMISNLTIPVGGSGLAYGIFDQLDLGSVANIYFNSILISGTATGNSATYCYAKNFQNVTNFKNNILVNNKTSTGLYVQAAYYFDNSSGAVINSDYNDFYNNGGNANILAVNNGTLYTDFATFQAAVTPNEINSQNIQPVFTSLSDLHLPSLTNAALNNLGTPVAGITSDIDLDVRDVTKPDIGADEFIAALNQVTITATAGVTGPTLYPNVGTAFNAINAGTHRGVITVKINTDTYETGPAVLNSSLVGSANYTSVSVQPSADGLTVTGIGIAGLRSLIELNGADNVTIDGDNPGTGGTNRNLSFTLASSTDNAIIWLKTFSAANGCLNNTIQNCNLTGQDNVNTIVGILAGSGTFGGDAQTGNNNNTIQNNAVKTVQNAIYQNGFATSPYDVNWQIKNNVFGSSVAAEKLSFRGMILINASGYLVDNNTIMGVSSGATSSSTMSGIQLGTGNLNGTISNNKISDIKQNNTAGWGSNGIWLNGTTVASNTNVYNNFISDVASYGFGDVTYLDNGYGIVILNGGGYNIYYNTVVLNTNQTSATGLPAALNVANTITTANTLNIRDNLFINTQTVGTQRYCVYSGAAASVYQDINYNNYYTAGANLGFIASNRSNLANWRIGTGKDLNSISTLPTFTSASDLHLVLGSNDLLKSGIAITGITADIDGDLRNLGLPTMGADETYLANLWAGNTSTNWATNTNWDNSITPSSGANIGIPFGVPNMPVLDANKTIGNLTFIRGGSSTLSLNDKTLTINGAVTGLGTLTGTVTAGVSTSNLVLTGAAGTVNFTQTSAATRSLNNLTLGLLGTATIGNALDVYGNVQVNNLTANAMNFNGQDVTLKSNINNTATIDKLLSGTTGANLTGATNVTVERWIPLRLTGGLGSGTGNNGRAYRVLTSTVSSGTNTINSSWQEGLKNTVIGVYKVPPSPYQNFGTHITGAGGSANGFDITQTNESSLYAFTNGSNINSTIGYPAVGNTNATIDGTKGYFIYIRGDRNVSTQLPYQPLGGMPTSSTTLRAKGSVLKGNVVYNISATPNDFSLITNPYPAPLDWDLVSAGNANITDFYYFWDPNFGIRGGFSTVYKGSSTHRYIQPGEGFFVQKNGTSDGTVTITEAMKAVGNNENTVFGRTQTTFESFRAELYLTEANNVRHTADEVLVRYDNNYSASVDGNDAEDIDNWNENIAIGRGGTRLAIESRAVITDKDTIPLFMNNMRKTNYEFEFTPSLFSNTGLTAELIDNYLNSRTLLSVTSSVTVPFTVNNDAGSFATNRFMVVFGNPSGPLPIDLSSVKAYEKNTGIQVDWVMNTEQDMDKYEVEKSADGRSFAKATTVASKGNSPIQVNYGWLDANPIFGDNFYRIKSLDKGGQYKYSNIVRVNMSKSGSTDISMYPNPYEGNGFNLQMTKFAAGEYMMTMYNSLGQRVYSGKVIHGGGSATQYINLGKDLAAGTYTVKISGGTTELTRTITKK